MFGRRTAIGVGCCVLALVSSFGCGGAVTPSGETDDPGAGAGSPTRAGNSAGGSAGTGAGAPGRAGAGGKPVTEPDPVDTACPVESLPPPILECDAYAANDCGPGSGCYPFVEHPEGKGCDAQLYGTRCSAAGIGVQGEHCGDDTFDWCAPGFVCVVGQRAGKRCAALCEPSAQGQCSGGLICGDLDVAGFGVCG